MSYEKCYYPVDPIEWLESGELADVLSVRAALGEQQHYMLVATSSPSVHLGCTFRERDTPPPSFLELFQISHDDVARA